MYVPFEKLPGNARIWVYQADRKLNSADKEYAAHYLASFTEKWTAHNHSLRASFSILHDWFIILAVDGNVNEASGCSIDASVRALGDLGQKLGTDLFNRTNIAVWKDGEVQLVAMKNLSTLLEQGHWHSDTTVFNNAVLTVDELNKKWMVPARESWLARYLNRSVLR